jgi:hypothetical protein
MKSFAVSVHSKIFDLSEEKIVNEYFKFLANFKIAVVIFNITPYIALCILAS